MKKELCIILLILIFNYSFGQQFTGLFGDYLHQTPPGDTPQLFAPGIVSKENSNEHCLAVSPKGDEMFFTTGTWPNSIIMHVKENGDKLYFLRFDYPNQTGDLYVAKASGDTLDEPVKLSSPISTEFNEVRPTVDPQGRYLLYVSDRPDGFGGKDIYVCYRNADGAWSVPQNLGSELNTPGTITDIRWIKD